MYKRTFQSFRNTISIVYSSLPYPPVSPVSWLKQFGPQSRRRDKPTFPKFVVYALISHPYFISWPPRGFHRPVERTKNKGRVFAKGNTWPNQRSPPGLTHFNRMFSDQFPRTRSLPWSVTTPSIHSALAILSGHLWSNTSEWRTSLPHKLHILQSCNNGTLPTSAKYHVDASRVSNRLRHSDPGYARAHFQYQAIILFQVDTGLSETAYSD